MNEPPWEKEMVDRLTILKTHNPKLYLDWLWYCREWLNLDPLKVPVCYLDNWLKKHA